MPVEPSVFVSTRLQVPCDSFGILKKHLIWVVSVRDIVDATISELPLLVSRAVIPFWKFDPKTVMGRYVLEAATNVGSMLVIPIPPEEVVVAVGSAEP